MDEGFYIQSIDIKLDETVRSLTKIAAMYLSGSIANGIVLAQNENPNIKIYKNKIEFGKCYNPEFLGFSGNIMTNYFMMILSNVPFGTNNLTTRVSLRQQSLTTSISSI